MEFTSTEHLEKYIQLRIEKSNRELIAENEKLKIENKEYFIVSESSILGIFEN